MKPGKRHGTTEEYLSRLDQTKGESDTAMADLAKIAGQRARARGEAFNAEHYGPGDEYTAMNAAWQRGWHIEQHAKVPTHKHVWENKGLYDECECGEVRA